MRVIIIGGVAAGMSAASKIKRMDSQSEVIVYEKGSFLSYGACGLPYYAAGMNDDYRKMIARTPEEFEASGIEIHIKCQVMKVFPQEKTVFVKNLETGQMFMDSYDKLMTATGARAIVPDIPGTNLHGVHLLKTMEDGFMLKEMVNRPEIQNIVIAGGGYIGIEAAETLNAAGKHVRVIEADKRILKPFDDEIEQLIRKHLERKGIILHLGERLKAIEGSESGTVTGIKTDGGSYQTDLVVLALGIRPASEVLKGTGVRTLGNGAILVDREMRTSLPDIYAAGDCASVYSFIEETDTYIALGTTANKCGRIAGENILGGHTKYMGTLGSAAIKAGDMEAARTGMSESTAKELGIEYTAVFVKTFDHAAYYPNPQPLWIKLICEKRSRRILGAQAAGYQGAVLRIDIFATAIINKMTAPELGMTDLCYAPPFAGVWDAVNIAANAVK